MDIMEAAASAKNAMIGNARICGKTKNEALARIRDSLVSKKDVIYEANRKDLERGIKEGLSFPLQKRLKFDDEKLNEVTAGIDMLIAMEDPAGRTLLATELDEGFELYKVSCPIGVIGVVFESRPDALVQISSLCLKSGNSVLLKGGIEAYETNKVLFSIIGEASAGAGISRGWIHLLKDRQDVDEMLKMDEYIDLVIPRGSNRFVRYIIDNTRIPVLGHADGICHCYIDEYADIGMALDITEDSKLQYVAVCNALETLLVHRTVAGEFLPAIKERFDRKNVTIYGCADTAAVIPVLPAAEDTYGTEHLDYAISVKVVGDLAEAIDHINRFGSGHTDTIVTNDRKNAEAFMDMVDSGNVFLNCSTRFSDGYRYGFGAEVGVSTNKIHARGPVGLEGLMIYKYKLIGSGQIAADYISGKKHFTHKKMDKVFTLE